jgi:hypothetical protein
MDPTFTPFYESNNELAYTGDDKKKHPTLRITDKSDSRICNLRLPLGTIYTAGRTWENNATENFITLADKDTHSVSAGVISICNVDNKNVTVVAKKPTLSTGWPAWYRGDEKLTIDEDTTEKDKTFTINRDDKRPITHKCGRETEYTFSVIFPKPNMERAKTWVNNEPQETQANYEPQETQANYEPQATLVIDDTLDYTPPSGAASKLSTAPKKSTPSARVIDASTVDDIIKDLDPTKVVNAWHVYNADPVNIDHIHKLKADIDTKFPEGTPVPFGKPNQIAKAWWVWAKKEENEEIVKVYAKIATDFNTANKANRPERKKRKANAKTGGRTTARKYIVDDSD